MYMKSQSTNDHSKGLWDLVIARDENINALIDGKIELNEFEIQMNQHWDDVMDVLQKRPEEAGILFQDQYPLERYIDRDYEDDFENILCPPPPIIKKIIDSHPNAVCVIDDQGETVLHRFCFYSSCSMLAFDIIKILCETYPQATRIPNKNGDIPLHRYMWSNDHNNDFSILPYLIHHTPHHFLFHQNCSGETPLDILCVRMGLIHQSSSVPMDFQLSPVLHKHCPTIEEQIKETWIHIMKLVSFASKGILTCDNSLNNRDACRSPHTHSFMELHSFIYFHCPQYLLQIAMELFPHQLTMRDPFFNFSTPLGIEVSSRIQHVVSIDDKRSDKLRKRFIVKHMLEKAPQVAILRCTDDLVMPLHLSLYSGNVLYHNDAIDLLTQADPSMLEMHDPKHHLYPFLLAACSKPQVREAYFGDNEEIEVQHLETIYSLLREVPWLMEHFAFDYDYHL